MMCLKFALLVSWIGLGFSSTWNIFNKLKDIYTPKGMDYGKPPIDYVKHPKPYVEPQIDYVMPSIDYAKPPFNYVKPSIDYVKPPIDWTPYVKHPKPDVKPPTNYINPHINFDYVKPLSNYVNPPSMNPSVNYVNPQDLSQASKLKHVLCSPEKTIRQCADCGDCVKGLQNKLTLKYGHPYQNSGFGESKVGIPLPVNYGPPDQNSGFSKDGYNSQYGSSSYATWNLFTKYKNVHQPIDYVNPGYSRKSPPPPSCVPDNAFINLLNSCAIQCGHCTMCVQGLHKKSPVPHLTPSLFPYRADGLKIPVKQRLSLIRDDDPDVKETTDSENEDKKRDNINVVTACANGLDEKCQREIERVRMKSNTNKFLRHPDTYKGKGGGFKKCRYTCSSLDNCFMYYA